MDYSTSLRTHTCGELDAGSIGQHVSLCGWVFNIRDHGGVIFLDLRDSYGVTQVVVKDDSVLHDISKETVVLVEGVVTKRDADTVNPKISTGEIEIKDADIKVLGAVYNPLPFEIATSTETKEDVRLKYRFLDLRNDKVRSNIVKRAQIISHLARQDGGTRLYGGADADSVGFFAGGRARLSRAEPQVQGPVLCPAAGAADFQAAFDGVRL